MHTNTYTHTACNTHLSHQRSLALKHWSRAAAAVTRPAEVWRHPPCSPYHPTRKASTSLPLHVSPHMTQHPTTDTAAPTLQLLHLLLCEPPLGQAQHIPCGCAALYELNIQAHRTRQRHSTACRGTQDAAMQQRIATSSGAVGSCLGFVRGTVTPGRVVWKGGRAASTPN